jgi:subtilisin family serine protease
MKQYWKSGILLGLALALFPWSTPAQNVYNYILQSPNRGAAEAACHTYGMTILSTIRKPDTYLVQVSAALPPNVLQQWVQHDPNVNHLELDNNVSVPETALTTAPYIPPMPLTDYVTDGHLIQMYGNKAWVGYVQQPAVYATNAWTAMQQNPGRKFTVAVIDTGIDPNNPILAPVLVSGYDFTRNVAGYASDLADINQSTAAILDQTPASSGPSYQAVVLNESTVAMLEQSTAAILDGDHLPHYFGHGTMVAGLIHLVAPTARIMSLKAFHADGTANQSDIISAIYYAVDHGASVINMSFELTQISDTLLRAINYADRKGVICVASAGNEGLNRLVYPAAYGNVISVGSVDQQSQQSSFTNFGPDLVRVAAPGEALITTYPGNHYAAAWGTSFSSAIVAGIVADLLSAVDQHLAPALRVGDLQRALSHARSCGNADSLGAGCLDFNQAVQFIKGTNLPH